MSAALTGPLAGAAPLRARGPFAAAPGAAPVTALAATAGTAPGATAGAAATPVPWRAGARFDKVLAQARGEGGSTEVAVKAGDTLTSIVRAQWVAGGGKPEDLSAGRAHRWALQVAADNGLANPDRILVGQRLQVAGQAAAPPVVAGQAGAPAVVAGLAPAPTPPAVAPASAAMAPPASGLAELAPVALGTERPAGASLVLNQTLDRAVQRGFIPAQERRAVEERIEALAQKHGFRGDDFARAVLMESDGLNPQASNGRCFGIIQFCAGPDRGAASAGYARQPQAILKLSVLQQLDLVDRYFDDTRLRDFRGGDGAVRLDDLYLTILTPAARQERRLAAPLPIAGTQALDLHVGRDRQAPITRGSILSGLHANARERLGQLLVASASLR